MASAGRKHTLQLLGGIRLTGPDGEPSAELLRQSKRLALLICLACARAGGALRRDTLSALFWPEADEARARNALSQSLHVLRKTLGPEVIRTEGEFVALDPERIACDVWAFEEAFADGRLEEAAALYGGDFAPGFHTHAAPELDQLMEAKRQELCRMAREALHVLAEGAEAAGRMADAVAFARRAADVGPVSEEAVRRLMRLLAESGDRPAALRVFADLEARLLEEFEIEPSRETASLAREIRAALGTPERAKDRRAEGAPPPKGLEALPDAPHRSRSAYPPPRTSRRAPGRLVVPAALLGLASIALFLKAGARHPLQPGEAVGADAGRSLLILPFRALDDTEDARAAARGFSEDLLTRLASVPGIRVIAPPALWSVRGDAVESAELPPARWSLEGSVRTTPGGAHVTMRVTDLASGEVLLARGYLPGRDDDLIAFQARLAVEVARALLPDLGDAQLATVRIRPTAVPDAWMFVLRARDVMFRGGPSGPDPNAHASALLDSALALDPRLADAHGLRAILFQRYAALDHSLVDSALAAGERAVALAPERSLPHLALAYALRSAGAPVDTLLALLLKAATLAPGDPELGRGGAGIYQSRIDRSAAWLRWQEVTGASRNTENGRIWTAWILGRYDEAVAGYRRLVTLYPSAPELRVRLAEVLLGKDPTAALGVADEALADGTPLPPEVEALVSLYAGDCERVLRVLDHEPHIPRDSGRPPPDEFFVTSGTRPTTLVGACLLRRGDLGRGLELLAWSENHDRAWIEPGAVRALDDFMWYDLARVLALQGRREEALDALETAVAHGWPFANIYMGEPDPLLASLRDDPRFGAAIARARAQTATQASALDILDPARPPPTLAELVSLLRSDLEKARTGVPPPEW